MNKCKNCDTNILDIEYHLTGLCEECESSDDFCNHCGDVFYTILGNNEKYYTLNNKRYCETCYSKYNSLTSEITYKVNKSIKNFDLEALEKMSKA